MIDTVNGPGKFPKEDQIRGKDTRMDQLERSLANVLKSIPSGGGEYGAYGVSHHADSAAKIIRWMIEEAANSAGK